MYGSLYACDRQNYQQKVCKKDVQNYCTKMSFQLAPKAALSKVKVSWGRVERAIVHGYKTREWSRNKWGIQIRRWIASGYPLSARQSHPSWRELSTVNVLNPQSHTLTVMLSDPETMCKPSGENATDLTQSSCPLRASPTCCPVGVFHTLTVMSSDPEAIARRAEVDP